MSEEIKKFLKRARAQRSHFKREEDFEEFESYYLHLKLAGNKQRDAWIVADWMRMNYGQDRRHSYDRLAYDMPDASSHNDTPEALAIAKQTAFEIAAFGHTKNLETRKRAPDPKSPGPAFVLGPNYSAERVAVVVRYASTLAFDLWVEALVTEALLRSNGNIEKASKKMGVSFYTMKGYARRFGLD